MKTKQISPKFIKIWIIKEWTKWTEYLLETLELKSFACQETQVSLKTKAIIAVWITT